MTKAFDGYGAWTHHKLIGNVAAGLFSQGVVIYSDASKTAIELVQRYGTFTDLQAALVAKAHFISAGPNFSRSDKRCVIDDLTILAASISRIEKSVVTQQLHD